MMGFLCRYVHVTAHHLLSVCTRTSGNRGGWFVYQGSNVEVIDGHVQLLRQNDGERFIIEQRNRMLL